MIEAIECVKKIKPYIPGKPIKELERELGIKGSIKLASNENPLGPSPKALNRIMEYLANNCDIHRYPDGNSYYLKSAIAEKLGNGITLDEIIVGNGSNELIDIAVRTFMTDGDEAVMASPSFVVYSMAVDSVCGKAIEVPLKDYRHDLQAIADKINEKTKIVFIANPNNPTGTINKKDEFNEFMSRVPENVLVVVDEAYFEYVTDKEYPNTLGFLNDNKNILILRTFSKAYGLAGLRIGYGISKKEIINELNKIREPFNTNTIAQMAAVEALSDREHLKKSIEINEEGKRFLYKELNMLGIQYIPTEANFIYILLNIEAKKIYEALLRQGIIVRPVGDKEIRVTIGMSEENRFFIEKLKIALNEFTK